MRLSDRSYSPPVAIPVNTITPNLAPFRNTHSKLRLFSSTVCIIMNVFSIPTLFFYFHATANHSFKCIRHIIRHGSLNILWYIITGSCLGCCKVEHVHDQLNFVFSIIILVFKYYGTNKEKGACFNV